jgi:CO/xanthine dehydrogenase Mo-binding subunit
VSNLRSGRRANAPESPSRRVEVVIGTQANGQRHETSFAQVVSALLAVPVDSIDLVTGYTDRVSLGGGSFRPVDAPRREVVH